MTSYKPENTEKRTDSGLSLLQWLLLLAVVGVVVTVVASQFL